MNKKIFSIILISFFVLIPFTPTLASNDSVFLAQSETIDDAYYFNAGGSVELAGTVLGDVLVAGGNVNITGEVRGDIIAAGGNVKITGPVGGNIRIAGGQITIDSHVEKNILVFGGSILLSPESNINGGVMVFGGNVEFRGKIQKNTRVFAGNLAISGEINNDLEAYIESDNKGGRLIVYPGAIINGNIEYTSYNKIDIKDGAQIDGKITHKLSQFKGKNLLKFLGFFWLASKFYFFLVLLVVALIFLLICPKKFEMMEKEMLDSPLAKLGYGFVILILTPIICFIALFTIVGIPIALAVMAIYFITLYVVKIFVSYTLGKKVLEWLGVKKTITFWTIVLGIIIFLILSSIPFIGWIFDIVLVTWALGALWALKKKKIEECKTNQRKKK